MAWGSERNGAGGEAALPRRACLGLLAGGALWLAGGCQGPRRPGELIVGSSPTGVPFTFVDPWTNGLTGGMIESTRAILAAAGRQGRFETVAFAALIPSLLAGKIDLIAAAMVRTEARARVVGFTDPVMHYSGGLAVAQNDRRPYPALAALRGLRVGAQVGSLFVDQLHDAGVTDVATYDSLTDILRDLSLGRIVAGYGDAPIMRYQLRVGPRRAVHMVEHFTPPARQDLCLVARQGDPVIGRLNRAIAQLRPGPLDTIAAKWGLA